MKEKRSTKNALISSVLVLALSVSMLVGTTFAWFTDSSSAAVNSIKSGGLDVVLEMKQGDEWVDADGKTLGWIVNGTVAENQTNILWEPNCTYSLQSFRIRNAGNLALKYQVAITGIAGSAKLNEAIKWTYQKGTADAVELTSQNLISDELLPGKETEAITITGHMKQDAGNEYQNLEIKGIGVTVVATQYISESDSNNNEYDTNAPYLNTDAQGNYLISNADELVYFAKDVNVNRNAYAGKTVKLTGDIDLSNKSWTPIGANFKGTFDGGNYTIKNMTVSNADTAEGCASGFFGVVDAATIQNVNFENANVTGHGNVGVVAGIVKNTETGTGAISGCNVVNSTVEATTSRAGGIAGFLNGGAITRCSVKQSTITAVSEWGKIVGSKTDGSTDTENTDDKVTLPTSTEP